MLVDGVCTPSTDSACRVVRQRGVGPVRLTGSGAVDRVVSAGEVGGRSTGSGVMPINWESSWLAG